MKTFIIDSNVPLIATGQIGEAWAVVILEEISKGRFKGVTDVFFVQEILDRYHNIGENFKGRKISKAFRKIMDSHLDVTVDDFDLSYKLFQEIQENVPRELIHSAVMKNAGLLDIFSVDGPNFDVVPGIHIIHLPELLKALELQGHYINERKNK